MKFYGIIRFTNNGGRDSALRCPRRRAQRQATESDCRNLSFATPVPPSASLRAGTPQRGVPTKRIVCHLDNSKVLTERAILLFGLLIPAISFAQQ
jgi:hypothetical protein